jgi:Ca-activated chloride channel family protein
MFPGLDPRQVHFAEPVYLWLLVVPAALLPIWAWQVARRRRDLRRIRAGRVAPSPGRFAALGDLSFWLCLILALGFLILAVAEPAATTSLVRTAGIDLVVLQDGSASMHVRDTKPDRWQRSMLFLRRLAESLEWRDDRIALALFAHIAAPQVRLTRDVNTLYFFLDHLGRQSPLPLEDDTTWDTNVEVGIYWGVRLIDRDEALHGKSPNSKAFVLVTDGQAWSGEVDRSLTLARARNIPVFVVGVGTTSGGYIPEPADRFAKPGGQATGRVASALDRGSLLAVARAGRGQYFELDRDSDRTVATAIVEATRRRAGPRDVELAFTPLYWQCFVAAAVLLGLGTPWARDRMELSLHALGALAALLFVWTMMR